MLVILEAMNIDLTVDEFVEIYKRTEFFGNQKKIRVEIEKKAGATAPFDEAKQEEKKEEVKKAEKDEKIVEAVKKDLIDREELKKLLNIGESTVWYFRTKGMPCVNVSTNGKPAYMYDKDAVLKWYKSHEDKKYKNGNYKKSGKPKAVAYNSESSYSNWRHSIDKICFDAGKDVGKMLSLTFKYMTKNYGIVWDQEAKEFAEANGHKPYSTSQLAHWFEHTKPAYKNLTVSCLETVIKEAG